MHLPWTSWKNVEKVYDFIGSHPVDVIIQLGDLYDLFSYSKFARSQDEIKPHEEIDLAQESAASFWKAIHKIAPKAEKKLLIGNHGERLYKRACERWPEIAKFVAKLQADIHTFPNVETIHDGRAGVFIDDVLYIHGYLTQLGQHMRSLGANVVHGHTHRAGILIEQHMGKKLFELDCGYLADPNAVPLQYGPTKHIKWVQGFGVIDKFGPRFISTEAA